MPDHELYMRRCLELAALGAGYVSPNPMVGAVIVCDGQIIGEGYHHGYGQAHAEINAIEQVYHKFKNAADLLSRSTIYVSLEPCAHYGKTPPCALRIIREKIPEVVIGCRDSFHEVNGRGINMLREAGITVTENILQKECTWQNRRFFMRNEHRRPYVILKWAETAGGYFAPADGSQYWISGEESRRLVHKWRSEEDCVLVGKNTALADNPQLNVRYGRGRNPKRAVIDGSLSLPAALQIFNEQQETFIFNRNKTVYTGKNKYTGIEDFDLFLPQYILYQLYLQDISSVMIEGGIKTLQTFIDAGLWDEARIFTGKNSIAEGMQAPLMRGNIIKQLQVAADELRVTLPENGLFLPPENLTFLS